MIRREFRLAEGDPFNSIAVKRSRDRIQSLGFFQENLEIKQEPGSTPDRVILGRRRRGQSTGELQLSAGFSSIERFLVNLSIRPAQLHGQRPGAARLRQLFELSKSVELGFTEPYVFDRNIAIGGDVYRRDYNSFNYIGNDRNTTYQQSRPASRSAPACRLPNSPRWRCATASITTRSRSIRTSSSPIPTATGRWRRSAILCSPAATCATRSATRVTSSIGYSVVYDTLNNRLRPTSGTRAILNQDFRRPRRQRQIYPDQGQCRQILGPSAAAASSFSASVEGGYILSLETAAVRLGRQRDRQGPPDRPLLLLGEPQIRGFDIRGVGPRVQRRPFVLDANGNYTEVSTDRKQFTDDSLGGPRLLSRPPRLEIPLGSSGRELGIRPSIFVDAGALCGLKNVKTECVLPGNPLLNPTPILPAPAITSASRRTAAARSPQVPVGSQCPTGTGLAQNPPRVGVPYQELYLGDSPKPRVSVGIGVNWNSPFGAHSGSI